MNIYSKVKEIFHTKDKEIEIIQPPANAKRLPVGVKHHKSKWKKEEFSGLIEVDFCQDQIDLINQLISKNEWIEEESMDLITLIEENSRAN